MVISGKGGGVQGPQPKPAHNADMPEDIWDEAMECIATGIGQPARYNYANN